MSTIERLVAVALERVGTRSARLAVAGPAAGTIAVMLAFRAPHAEGWNGFDGAPRDLALVLADFAGADPAHDRRLLADAAEHLAPDGSVIGKVGNDVLEAER